MRSSNAARNCSSYVNRAYRVSRVAGLGDPAVEAPGMERVEAEAIYDAGREACVDFMLELTREMQARNVLEQTLSIARQAGVEASASLLRARKTSDLLIAEASGHDLLVLGCHGGSRLGGFMLGGTATRIAHSAERPTTPVTSPSGSARRRGPPSPR